MISYYTSINIHLSLEDYYNQGLSSERAKAIIEDITDPFDYVMQRKLWCKSGGINGNWIVQSSVINHEQASILVNIIEQRLYEDFENI